MYKIKNNEVKKMLSFYAFEINTASIAKDITDLFSVPLNIYLKNLI